MKESRSLKLLTILFAVWLFPTCGHGDEIVPNASFEKTYIRQAEEPEIQNLKKLGWKLADPVVWPSGWGAAPVSIVQFEVTQNNPHSGSNCILLTGQSGSSGYLGVQVKGLKEGIYRASFFSRGEGTVTLMVGGTHIILNAKPGAEWTELAGIYRHGGASDETSVTLQAQNGTIFIDDVSLIPCDPLEAMVVEEKELLRREGKLPTGDGMTREVFAGHLAAVREALPKLTEYVKADPIPENVSIINLLGTRMADLEKIQGAPDREQAQKAIIYHNITENLLTELQFEDAKEE